MACRAELPLATRAPHTGVPAHGLAALLPAKQPRKAAADGLQALDPCIRAENQHGTPRPASAWLSAACSSHLQHESENERFFFSHFVALTIK